MKGITTTALAAFALALGTPVASADPDGYQPQLRTTDPSDVVSRYLNHSAQDMSDVVDRAVAARTPVAPRDAFDRAPVADRPVSIASASRTGDRDGLQGFQLAGAIGLALLAGAAMTVLVPIGRRTPAHR
jgi:hypothetical protein